MAQKRVESSGDDAEMADANDDTTCARTDAKIVDRDVQMKYDIAKNEDGPLKRTKKPEQKHVLSQNPAESQPVAGPSSSTRTKGRNKAKAAVPVESQPSPLTVDPESLRKPGLEERLQNVETHLAVRFGPCNGINLPKNPTDTKSQFRQHHKRSLLVSNSWKIISFGWRRSIPHGLPSTSTNRIEVYVHSIVTALWKINIS